jgi:hypothetical protein
VEQNVIGLEGGVGFEFAAPVSLVVLLREKKLAGIIDGAGDTAEQAVNFAKAQLWSGG